MEKQTSAETIDRQILAALTVAEDAAFDPEDGLRRLRHAQSLRRSHRRRQAWIAGGAVAALAVFSTAPQTRAYAVRCVDACVDGGGRLGQLVLDRVQPTQGKRTLPADFALPDSQGRIIRLSDFRGKVVVLNFWATWCPPCREEIPWFVEFQKQYAGRGFTVAGIALDEEGWRKVMPFITHNAINYPIVLGNDDLLAAYGGVETLPSTLIIDRNGRVTAAHSGLVPREVYEQEIAAALAKPK